MKKTKLTNTKQDKKEETKKLKEFYESEKYQENKKYILTLEKEIKKLNQKIENLTQEKKQKVWQAMESENTALSKEIRKPRAIKKLTRFFVNRFNTYQTIMKTVLEPIRQRMDEFKLQNAKEKIEEFDFSKMQEDIQKVQDDILEDINNKLICQRVGVLNR